MRSTKDQLVEKDVLMPVKQCFPVEPSGCRRVLALFRFFFVCFRISSGLHGNTAADSVRSGCSRCGAPQPKKQNISLRAQAQLMRTETVETFELVKVKQKTFKRERRENARGARAGVTF
ncbi:hypothetical protein TNCV_1254261 [Trichonephila clavipes]|nr:hypothetical protein TNCV_1254261 [Trichonephila clavipes]